MHTVGNVGRCRGGLRWPLLAAYATLPLYTGSLQVVHYTALASVLGFEYGAKEWRRTPHPPRSVCRRVRTEPRFSRRSRDTRSLGDVP